MAPHITDTNIIQKNFLNRIVDYLEKNNADEIEVIDFKLTDSGINEMGANFCSEALHFSLTYERHGKTYQKRLFLKIPYSIPAYEIIRKIGLYRKELHMYEKVFPLFKASLPDEPPFWPKYYCSDGNDAFALEDLTQNGYTMLKPYHQLGFEHCAIALSTLAKFHALSVKVDETRPHVLDAVRSEVVMTSSYLDGKTVPILEERFSRIVSLTDPQYAEKHAKSLGHFKKRMARSAIDELQPSEKGFNVLNHGDFWANNILFRYDSTERVSNAKIVDFQNCRWSSPASDVVYFAINSMRFEVFENHFDELLDIYTTTLNATMKRLNCERGPLSLNELKSSIDSKCSYWIIKLVTTTPHVLARCKQSNTDDYYDDKLTREEAYIDISKKWMRYFIKKGVFEPEENIDNPENSTSV